MTDREDDDEQRKSTAGRVERAPIPGAPTRHLPPVRLRPAADEHTPPQTVVAKRRANERRTQIGVAPPAPGSAPAALAKAVAQVPPSVPPSTGDRNASLGSLVPAPWDDTTENRVAAVKAGYRTAYVPSSPPPQPAYAEPAWWRSASGMVKVIGAAAAALIGSTTAITAIIGALHQPPAPPPAPVVSADPCPLTVPPLQRSAFCVRLDQMQQAANTASADAADAKVGAARAERHADQIEEKIPKIKGLPKP